jgi:hypothetical protein
MTANSAHVRIASAIGLTRIVDAVPRSANTANATTPRRPGNGLMIHAAATATTMTTRNAFQPIAAAFRVASSEKRATTARAP